MGLQLVYTSMKGRLSRGGMLVYGVLIPFIFFLAVISFERQSLAIFPAFLTALEWVLLAPSLESVMSLRVRVGSGNGQFIFEWHEILKYLAFWPSIVVSVKRFHDIGLSARIYGILTAVMAFGFLLVLIAWFGMSTQSFGFGVAGKLLFASLALIFLPSLAMLIIHLVLPGQPYENRFGADPRDS